MIGFYVMEALLVDGLEQLFKGWLKCFFFIIVKRFSLDEIPEIWMLITLSWLMMIVGQAPPLSTSLALIGRHFFHIMFQNLVRGPAALRALNFPCVPASKLQSHWSRS